jgi:hypothetical protein
MNLAPTYDVPSAASIAATAVATVIASSHGGASPSSGSASHPYFISNIGTDASKDEANGDSYINDIMENFLNPPTEFTYDSMAPPKDNEREPETLDEKIFAAPANQVKRGKAPAGAAVDPQKDLENRWTEFEKKEQAARGRNNEGPNVHGIDHNRGGA